MLAVTHVIVHHLTLAHAALALLEPKETQVQSVNEAYKDLPVVRVHAAPMEDQDLLANEVNEDPVARVVFQGLPDLAVIKVVQVHTVHPGLMAQLGQLVLPAALLALKALWGLKALLVLMEEKDLRAHKARKAKLDRRDNKDYKA